MAYLKPIDEYALALRAFTGGIVSGASIRTPCGPRRIELVRAGDLVVTRDNGLQPVRMVWKRRVTAADMTENNALAPVRLKPRAIGPMMPAQDLCLAMEHRILMPGYRVLGQDRSKSCLIEVADIAGSSDGAYVDRSSAELTFVTLVFDNHQVFPVNGLPVESFLPTPANVAALGEELRTELVRRFPQLRREPNAYPPAEYPFVAGAEYVPDV